MIITAVIVLYIVARWLLFEKMGEKGWKSLIPVYAKYVECKAIGVNPWWILLNYGLPIFQPFISIYFTILLNVSLARSFGKKDAYTFGLIFLPVVFIPMLAFDSSVKFLGKKPLKDIILDKFK